MKTHLALVVLLSTFTFSPLFGDTPEATMTPAPEAVIPAEVPVTDNTPAAATTQPKATAPAKKQGKRQVASKHKRRHHGKKVAKHKKHHRRS